MFATATTATMGHYRCYCSATVELLERALSLLMIFADLHRPSGTFLEVPYRPWTALGCLWLQGGICGA
jgi:hypothetical protein